MEKGIKKTVKKVAMAAGLAIFSAQYAINFNYRCLSDFPETEVSSLSDRIDPFDQLKNIPKAIDYGLLGTTIGAGSYSSRDKLPRSVNRVIKTVNGLASTLFDTALNLSLWIPREIYQAKNGEVWSEPVMPFSFGTGVSYFGYLPKGKN